VRVRTVDPVEKAEDAFAGGRHDHDRRQRRTASKYVDHVARVILGSPSQPLDVLEIGQIDLHESEGRAVRVEFLVLEGRVYVWIVEALNRSERNRAWVNDETAQNSMMAAARMSARSG
jgi:hypothetical protein